jgi:predicted transcriptional regulator of viral defense system
MLREFPSLSPRELALLSELDRKHRTQVTSDEARELLGAATHRVLSDMARKGLLNRVSRGVYVVRPLRSVARPWTVSALAAVEHLLTNEPHYIGGLVAVTLHRLTEQLYASVVDAYVLSRRCRLLRQMYRTAPQGLRYGSTTATASMTTTPAPASLFERLRSFCSASYPLRSSPQSASLAVRTAG